MCIERDQIFYLNFEEIKMKYLTYTLLTTGRYVEKILQFWRIYLAVDSLELSSREYFLVEQMIL